MLAKFKFYLYRLCTTKTEFSLTIFCSLHSRTKIAEHWNTSPSILPRAQGSDFCSQGPNAVGRHHTRHLAETPDGSVRYDGQPVQPPLVIDVTREREIINDDGTAYTPTPRPTSVPASFDLENHPPPSPWKHWREVVSQIEG